MKRQIIESYFEWTDENFEWASNAFNHLKEETRWTHQKIVSEVEKHNKQIFPECKLDSVKPDQLSRFLKRKKSECGCIKTNFEYFVRYAYENGIDEGKIPEELNATRNSDVSLYKELSKFLSINPHIENKMRNRSEGVYKVYRRSTVLPNKVIMGVSTIDYLKEEQSVVVSERYCYKPSNGSDNKITFRGMEENYSGCMSKSDNKYIFFLKDTSGSALQITIFTNITRTKDQIHTMKGIVLGILGDDIYSLPIYYERYDGDKSELEQDLDIHDQNRIPEAVLSYVMSEVNG